MSEILNIKDAENYKLPNNNININETDKLKDEENTIEFPITSETKLDSYEDENNTKINDKSFDSQLENENNKLEIKEVNHKLEAINGNFMPSAILLEKRKIDVNEIIDSDGNTLLHLAVKYSYLNVVKTLIELFNADVNYKNNFGETPFHLVCTNERQDLFVSSYFLNLDNVDFDCQDYNGVTPLLKTIHNYYFNMFYSLVYKKCDLNHIDKEGKNIFNYSLESDNIIVLKFALKHLGVKTFKESVPNFTDTLISLNGNKCCKYLLKYYFDSISSDIEKDYAEFNLNYPFILSLNNNDNFIITYSNNTLCLLLDYTIEEIKGKDFTEFLPFEISKPHNLIMKQFLFVPDLKFRNENSFLLTKHKYLKNICFSCRVLPTLQSFFEIIVNIKMIENEKENSYEYNL